MEDFLSIVVEPSFPVTVVHNPTAYPLIGLGAQGAVFKLSDDRCVKIYGKEKYARSEGEVLKAGQRSSILPKLYEVGPSHIVMEYIPGPPLDEYLKRSGVITESMAEQILFVWKEMKRLKFTRLDANLRHLMLTQDGKLKVIDHVNSLKKKFELPKLLLKDLDRLWLRKAFMEHVKKQNPELYRKWKSG